VAAESHAGDPHAEDLTAHASTPYSGLGQPSGTPHSDDATGPIAGLGSDIDTLFDAAPPPGASPVTAPRQRTGPSMQRVLGVIRLGNRIALGFGMWFAATPLIFGYTGARESMLLAVAAGLSIALLAAARLALPTLPSALAWPMFVIAGWVVFSPWVLSYPPNYHRGPLQWNNVTTGLVVGVIAAFTALLASMLRADRRRLRREARRARRARHTRGGQRRRSASSAPGAGLPE
jgi:hypothetical protein